MSYYHYQSGHGGNDGHDSGKGHHWKGSKGGHWSDKGGHWGKDDYWNGKGHYSDKSSYKYDYKGDHDDKSSYKYKGHDYDYSNYHH